MAKKILIIDNYDSFTHNLYHLLRRIRPDCEFRILRNRDKSMFHQQWDALVISPGPMGPSDTGLLKNLFESDILPEKKPVLGICLGMQFLAWYYGLTISPSTDACHGRIVNIKVRNKDLFRGINGRIKVVRYNSLAIEESKETIESRSPLLVTAVQENNSMIMALKHKDLPFSGVQFHPESFLTEKADHMINNFFKDYIDD